MQLRYNYRLDPWPRHRVALGKAFGCARMVFNDALHAREAAHQAGEPYVTDSELSARLTAIKATPGRAWLNEVSSVVLQQALADLNAAYRNFFASLNEKRKGPKVAKPRFRSRKDHRQAIRFTANARFRVLANGELRLPKIGDVPVRWSRPLPSDPSSVTVVRDSAGRYFASFVIETQPNPPHCRRPNTRWASTWGSPTSPSSQTGARSPLRSSFGGQRRSSVAHSEICCVSRRAPATGPRPGSRSPAHMPGWRTPGATSTTNCLRR